MSAPKITAEVRLWDPSYETAEGQLVVPPELLEFTSVEFRNNATVYLPGGPVVRQPCDHESTICPECMESWAEEHHVRIYRDGDVVIDTELVHWIGLRASDYENWKGIQS